MSLAENLLNSLGETRTASPEQEPHIIIGADRFIKVPEQLKKIAVTNDKDIETVRFDCVRYWDGYDLSTFAIYLNIVLPNGVAVTYIPKNITTSENFYHFDWVVEGNITPKSGTIGIGVTAIKTKTNGNGDIVTDKRWSSFPNTEVSIVKGFDIENVPSEEESSDVIAQLSAILEEIQSNLEDIVDNTMHGIPEYWQPHLDNRVEDVRRAMELAGRNKSSFFFYSDAHWDANNTYTVRMAPKLLKYLYKKTPINKTNYGGDFIGATETTDTGLMSYIWDWREQLRDLPNHHSVVGNHDDGNATDRLFSKEYIYAYLFAPEENNDIVWGDYFYYYIDDKSESTRYLYLDVFYDGVSSKQVNFVKQALLSTPEDWHIIAICHAWFANDYSVYPPVLNGFATETKRLLDMFDNYNARSNDFTYCGGKVELCIGGHYHLDHYDFTDGGIPVVIVEADTLHNRSGTQPQKLTKDESAISAVVVKYNTQEVDIIRIGRGNSFTLDMQSGSVTTYYSVTFNLTNVEATNMSNKIEKDGTYFTTITPTIGEIKSVTVTAGGVDVTSESYDAPSGEINVYATGDIVITAVAEAAPEPEPEPDTPTYTNVIKTSIGKDGNIFNGGKGWADNSRIGSGGIYLGNGTYYVTGHMPIDKTKNNTIYLEDVTFGAGGAIAFFDSAFARVISNVPANWITADNISLVSGVITDGKLTQFEINSNKFSGSTVVYFAIQSDNLGDDSIITINEPIE